jgi:hypothetical protein
MPMLSASWMIPVTLYGFTSSAVSWTDGAGLAEAGL